MWWSSLIFLQSAFATSTVDLTPSIPVRGTVASSQWAYYRLALPAGQQESLTVTVTPTAGDPDLYISLTGTPDTSAPYKSLTVGQDSLEVPYQDFETNRYAYLGVRGFSAATFSIVATFSDDISLLDGIPQNGWVSWGETASFEFDIRGSTPKDVTITATPLTGNVRAFVSSVRTPAIDPSNPSTYFWSTPPYSAGAPLVIAAHDAHWPAVTGTAPGNQIFFITVMGTSSSNSAFSLVAATNHSNTLLRLGVPQRDSIAGNELEYFMVDVALPRADTCSLTISVTSITGDPDLFMSRLVEHPNAQTIGEDPDDRFSVRFGADDITYDPAKSGLYYIGVGAWQQNSTFMITPVLECENVTSAVTLLDGIPQSADLTIGRSRLYQFTVHSGMKDISVSLTPRSGDPDVYIRNDGAVPGMTSYQWKGEAWGADHVLIHAADPNFCTGCTYLILVHASSNCSYTVQVSTSTAVSTLQQGVPRVDTLMSSEYEYFQIPIAHLTQELTITVTPFGLGDPDLYISTHALPNASFYTWAAMRGGADAITIPTSDPHACIYGCTYYIAVRGFTTTTFTIVASFDSPQRLVDGVPQHGTVAREAIRYYELQVSSGHQSLNVFLSAQSGNAMLLIRKNDLPEVATATWTSSGYGSSQFVTISEAQGGGCNTTYCRYYIGVYGSDGPNCTYSITAATAEVSVPLRAGSPQQGHLESGGWAYYSLRIDKPNFEVNIAVTSTSGDPDLYVSAIHSHPNSTQSEWRSLAFGSDTVDIVNASVGYLYIGVYGFLNTSFSIAAVLTDPSTSTSTPITLLLGEPQEGELVADRFRLYTLSLPEVHDELDLTITSQFGQVELFAVKSALPLPFAVTCQSCYTWRSQQTSRIRITQAAAGTYTLAVHANNAALYTVVAAGKQARVTLQNGVSFRASLGQHEYRYYKFTSTRTDADINFALTAFEGDPDMYISTTNSTPSQSSYDWSATSYQTDGITIPYTDRKFCGRCTYYIAIYSFSASTYTITATSARPVALLNGVPQQGTVNKHTLTYYRFALGKALHTDITFIVTPIDGSVVMFISTNDEPTATDYMWAGTYPGMATVRPTDPHFCSASNCTYHIGIYGVTDASFAVLVITGTGVTTLQTGLPVRGWADTNTWEYYLYDVGAREQDVDFSLTSITGDPDMFVSRKGFPNATFYEWSSRTFGSDVVGIENATVGLYYIGILAYQNTTFTLTALSRSDARGSITRLRDGQPQTSAVNQGDYSYYRFTMGPSRVSELIVTVTRRAGDPDVYITNSSTILPSQTNYQWKSSQFGTDTVMIPDPAPNSVYTIGVLGFSNAVYDIVATSGDLPLQLLAGVPFSRDIPSNSYRYFVFSVDRTDEDLTVTVTPFGDGDPDLYISRTNPRPNATSYDWVARSFQQDSITIPSQELQLTTYYISVYGFRACRVTVMVSLSEDVILQEGLPQSGTVDFEASSYYRILAHRGSDVSVTLMPLDGYASLYIGLNQKPDVEIPATYQWYSDGFSSHQIDIYGDDENACNALMCTYYVNVVGNGGASAGTGASTQFSIVYTTASNSSTIHLRDSISQRGSLPDNQYRYYDFSVNSDRAIVTFALTALSGDPDLFVSKSVERPTTESYTWSSRGFGNELIVIEDPDQSSAGTYHIAVFSFRNCSYTITAHVTDMDANPGDPTRPVTLVDGTPQSGIISSTTRVPYSYYKFTTVNTLNHASVTIQVTPSFGDPDVFVNDNGIFPNSTYYKYESSNWGADSLTIPSKCAGQDSGCTATYLIAVHAFTDTSYTIVASASTSVIQLVSGVPVLDAVDGAETDAYYKIWVEQSQLPLVVGVTAITGDPDLYISTSPKPNATNCMWCAQESGNDVLSITSPTAGTYYYIGVHSFYGSCSFTVVATIGPINLVQGQPTIDILQPAEARQFLFVMNDPTSSLDVTFQLAITNGASGDILVSNLGMFPTSTADAMWVPRFDGDSVTISSSDSRACFNCSYYITVLAANTRLKYSITANLGGDNHQLLLAGNPVFASLSANGARFYQAIVDSKDRDVTIQLTAFVGRVQAFISTQNPFPRTAADGTWSVRNNGGSSSNGTSGHLTIPKTDPNLIIGSYYIGVIADTDCRYSLTLSTHNVMVNLGVPISATLHPPQPSYYFVNVDLPTAADITVIVTTAVTAPLSAICVSTESSEPNPTNADCQWRTRVPLIPSRSGEVAVNIPAGTSGYCHNCTYYIAIFPPTTADAPASIDFTLKVSTATTAEVVVDGTQVQGSVTVQGWKYYTMFVSSSSDVVVTLETCRGNADLYMSKEVSRPDEQHYGWHSAQTEQDDIITIKELTTATTFYIGVEGAENSDYRLETRTSLAPPTPVPVVGGGGQLRVSTPAADSVRIEFDRAAPSSLSSSPTTSLTYTVYYAKQSGGDDQTVMYSLCGVMATTQAGVPFTTDSTQVQQTIKGLDPGVYKFNIVVTDPAAGKAAALYNQETIEVLSSSEIPRPKSRVGIILAIVLPILCLLGIGLACMCRKNKQLTRELSIEMKDVPPAALRKAVAGPPSARSDKPYSNLLSENPGPASDELSEPPEDRESTAFRQV